VGEFVFLDVIVGITEASATRRPESPMTRLGATLRSQASVGGLELEIVPHEERREARRRRRQRSHGQKDEYR
jgi:hypothetical protein